MMNLLIAIDGPESREVLVRFPRELPTGVQHFEWKDSASATPKEPQIETAPTSLVVTGRNGEVEKPEPLRSGSYREVYNFAMPSPETPPEEREWYERQIAKLKENLADFNRQFPELHAKYDGQYVAMYEGKVVAFGLDKFAVNVEALGILGSVQFLLKKVTTEKEKPNEIPSMMFHLRNRKA